MTPTSKIPILLLKTKSTPTDAYQDLFTSPTILSSQSDPTSFSPQFVPVLQHRFLDDGLERVRSPLVRRHISRQADADFGGLIFTSQRAVEAFAKIYAEDLDEIQRSTLNDVPIYSVGPATTRALNAISSSLQVYGSHTGNGEALAHYILKEYPANPSSPRRPLLFPVGEQRRDIIPNTLMNPALPSQEQITVTEEVVYGTGVMESFGADFAEILAETIKEPERWVVVFSPTGCEAMLRCLGLLKSDDSVVKSDTASAPDRTTFIATIGPTTRDYLVNTFGFEPDVCAATPSPDGILSGILDFKSRRI